MIAEEYCGPINRDEAASIPPALLKQMYSMMIKIRLVEEKIADLVAAKEVVCPCHLYIGQEAIATGVCANLSKDDYVYSTHRSHGHYLAKGGGIEELIAEIYGRESGCSKGNGGSMHLAAPEIGFPGSSAIVGGTVPLAAGTALAFTLMNSDKVSVAFFGDGAATEGVLYETLNFAALKKLPVVFICENNFYSTHMHVSSIQSNPEIYKKAAEFNLPAVRIDGNDVVSVFKTAKKAIEGARSGKGPSFIECITYRWRGHVGPNWDLEKGLRSKEEVDWWISHCPVKRFEDLLFSVNIMSPTEKEDIFARVNDDLEEAVRKAKESPFPDAGEYKKKVFK